MPCHNFCPRRSNAFAPWRLVVGRFPLSATMRSPQTTQPSAIPQEIVEFALSLAAAGKQELAIPQPFRLMFPLQLALEIVPSDCVP